MNLHTEDEAKTKWCPMVRITPGNEHWHRLTNREAPLIGPDIDGHLIACRCIASACMAWRWATEYTAGPPRYEPEAKPVTRGYCGLAGRPE